MLFVMEWPDVRFNLGVYSASSCAINQLKETLIYSVSGMKRKEHGAQKARHIMKIGELSSTARRSDSPAQPINQRFLNLTVSQSDQGMQCKAKSGEKAEFTYSK